MGAVSTYALGLVGLPGTGKSTVAIELSMPGSGLVRLSTDQFHSAESRMSSHISRLFEGNDWRISLACQVEALALRASLQRSAGPSHCIDVPVEAVLAHTMAMHTLGMLSQDEFDAWMLLYEVVSGLLPDASFLVLLSCDRQELLRRTTSRGRLRDQAVSDAYLTALEESLRRVVQDSKASVIELDTTCRGPSEVVADVLRASVRRSKGLGTSASS